MKKRNPEYVRPEFLRDVKATKDDVHATKCSVVFACVGVVVLLVFQNFSYSKDYMRGVVTKISDGDTIRIKPLNARSEKALVSVRMIGMDTPEVHLPSDQGPVGQEPWGEQATEHLKSILPIGSEIVLEHYGKDKYGRILGRVLYKNRDINLAMVSSGWAVPYVICGDGMCNENFFKEHNVTEYLKACEQARSQETGIFDTDNQLDEMPFEFRLRIQKRTPDKYVGDYSSHTLHNPKDYNDVSLCERIFFFTKKDANNVGYH